VSGFRAHKTLAAFVAALTAALAAGRCAVSRSRPDTLVVLAGRDVEGLDPHTAGQVMQTQSLLQNVYEGLVTFDPQMSLVPALATSWTNPDDLTWDFRLRPDVPFQTGGILRADDVVYSLRRARDHPRSVLRAALANVVEIVELPAEGVRLRTLEPDASLISRLRQVFIVSRRALERDGEAAFERASSGTGPYAIAGRRPGALVDLKRFEDYWRGNPSIPKARFVAFAFGEPGASRFIPPGAVLLFTAPTDPAVRLSEKKNFVAQSVPGLAVHYLSLDLRKRSSPRVRLAQGQSGNPFLDARVREAIALALSYARIQNDTVPGGGALATQFVPPDVFGFNPALENPTQDVPAARRLLRETPYRDGFDLEIDLRRFFGTMGPGIVEDLAGIGIRARVNVLDEKDFFARISRGDSSAHVLRFFCWTGDAQEFFDDVVHSHDARRGLGEFSFSYERDPIEGLDDEIEKARQILPAPIRLKRLQDIMQRVVAAHLAIPLFQPVETTWTSPEVEWRPRADAFRLIYEAKIRDAP
jgi:peptide/nickel transport system substrate-binding protein